MRVLILLLFVLFSGYLNAQEIVINGVVKSKADVLPNASVQISDTKATTVSDSLGRFSFKINNQKSLSLKVSAVGYRTFVQKIHSGSQP